MHIFDYLDYKSYLNDLIRTFPKQGRGQARKLAEHLGVHSVVISQILAGSRDFTTEQALPVAAYFGLDDRATEYLMEMVAYARAGTHGLKSYHKRKLEKARAEHKEIKNRVHKYKELNDIEKSRFYSDWYYAGIALLSSIEGFNSVEAIASYFGLERKKVADVVSFLVATGLCKEEKGKIEMGITSTFVDNSSPYINGHRRNWRLKGLEKFTQPGPDDLFYSSPNSLSAEDAAAIRKQLLENIASVSKRVTDSPCESLMCLNIDWFKF